jgi:hypothetical protein
VPARIELLRCRPHRGRNPSSAPARAHRRRLAGVALPDAIRALTTSAARCLSGVAARLRPSGCRSRRCAPARPARWCERGRTLPVDPPWRARARSRSRPGRGPSRSSGPEAGSGPLRPRQVGSGRFVHTAKRALAARLSTRCYAP